MIKETCSCGATFECAFNWASDEQNGVREWREKHQHESQTVARDDPKVSSTIYDKDWNPLSYRYGMDTYTLNEDYILNGDGEPVWVSKDRETPKAFIKWAQNVSLNKPLDNLIEVQTDPSIYHS